jgi:uncharacterized protein (TIGR00730 family)
MRAYGLGNPELDAAVRALVSQASDNDNGDLITEMIVTALKLHRDGAARSELRLINTALKEMRYSTLVFSRHGEPKVTVFGSSRLPLDDPNAVLASDFSRRMAERGWGVVTGAGPGVMEAANRGAGREASYGVNIRLPFEDDANPHIDPLRVVNFKYFFTRKLGFVKEAHAFALFPGGFGTLDETFELLTLMQTGKSDLHPIVLIEAPGTGYWESVLDFIRTRLVDRGLVGASDLDLVLFTTDPEVAVEEIIGFYANYQSQRFVDGRLVLRLRVAPGPEDLARLSRDFSHILTDGAIEVQPPTRAEIEDGDGLEYERVVLTFDRRSFAGLRRLIDALNDLVARPAEVHPPEAFTDEQQRRPW